MMVLTEEAADAQLMNSKMNEFINQLLLMLNYTLTAFTTFKKTLLTTVGHWTMHYYPRRRQVDLFSRVQKGPFSTVNNDKYEIQFLCLLLIYAIYIFNRCSSQAITCCFIDWWWFLSLARVVVVNNKHYFVNTAKGGVKQWKRILSVKSGILGKQAKSKVALAKRKKYAEIYDRLGIAGGGEGDIPTS